MVVVRWYFCVCKYRLVASLSLSHIIQIHRYTIHDKKTHKSCWKKTYTLHHMCRIMRCIFATFPHFIWFFSLFSMFTRFFVNVWLFCCWPFRFFFTFIIMTPNVVTSIWHNAETTPTTKRKKNTEEENMLLLLHCLLLFICSFDYAYFTCTNESRQQYAGLPHNKA